MSNLVNNTCLNQTQTAHNQDVDRWSLVMAQRGLSQDDLTAHSLDVRIANKHAFRVLTNTKESHVTTTTIYQNCKELLDLQNAGLNTTSKARVVADF